MAARKGNVADLCSVTKRVQNWSQRKRRMFTTQHIESAWQRLHDHGWLGVGLPLGADVAEIGGRTAQGDLLEAGC